MASNTNFNDRSTNLGNLNNQAKKKTEDVAFTTWKKQVPMLYDSIVYHHVPWSAHSLYWLGRNEEKELYETHDIVVSRTTRFKNRPPLLSILEVAYPKEGKCNKHKLKSALEESSPVVSEKLDVVLPEQAIRVRGSSIKTQGRLASVQYSTKNQVDLFMFVNDQLTQAPRKWAMRENSLTKVLTTTNCHNAKGVTMAWNRQSQMFATADIEGKLFVHKIVDSNSEILSTTEKKMPQDCGEIIDLKWKDGENEVFGVCYSKGKIVLFDSRTAKKPISIFDIGLPIEGNKSQSFTMIGHTRYFAVGFSGSVDLFDFRRVDQTKNNPIHSYEMPGLVSNVEHVWKENPNMIVASAGNSIHFIDFVNRDKRFVHGGHMNTIQDFSMCPTDPNLIVSCSQLEMEEGNSVIQFWRPSWLYLKDETFVKQKLETELIPKLKEKQATTSTTSTTSNQTLHPPLSQNQSTTTTSNASKKRKQDDI